MLKIGDLVRIVEPPYSAPELYWTLAIVLENLATNTWGDERVLLHCILDGRQIKTTVEKLDTVED